MKLVKIQRQILQSAIEAKESHGVDKPITWFGRLPSDFVKSQKYYGDKMADLADAGIILAPNTLPAFSKVIDYDKAKKALEDGSF